MSVIRNKSESARTCKHNEDRDCDRYGVVDVSEERGDGRAGAQEQYERALIDRFGKFEEQRFGRGDRKLVVTVLCQ